MTICINWTKDEQIQIFIDNGSKAEFITQKCLDNLGLKRFGRPIRVTGIGGVYCFSRKGKVKIVLRSKFGKFYLPIIGRDSSQWSVAWAETQHWRISTSVTSVSIWTQKSFSSFLCIKLSAPASLPTTCLTQRSRRTPVAQRRSGSSLIALRRPSADPLSIKLCVPG